MSRFAGNLWFKEAKGGMRSGKRAVDWGRRIGCSPSATGLDDLQESC